MLPKRQARCDIDTLTWEYLDGASSPTRVAHLEEQLQQSRQAREAFLDHSTLHALLHDYYKPGVAEENEETAAAAEMPTAAPEPAQAPMPRRKRRRGKSSAA